MNTETQSANDQAAASGGVLSTLWSWYRNSARAKMATLGLWATLATGSAGWLAYEFAELNFSLSGMPRELSRIQDNLVDRASTIEAQHERIEDLMHRYQVLQSENPASPTVIERDALIERRASQNYQLGSRPGFEGGPLNAFEDLGAEATRAIPRPHPHPRKGPGAKVDLPKDLPLPASAKGAVQGKAFRPQPKNLRAMAKALWNSDERPDIDDQKRMHRDFRDRAYKVDRLYAAIETEQSNMVGALAGRVKAAVEERQSLLASLGLEKMGMGGPLIELTEAAPKTLLDEETQATTGDLLALIEDDLNLLEELNDTLTVMPLRLPVDAGRYFLSSRFGLRRDPMTKRRAFHAGLDLAGARGTPVRAASAGVVVRAGRFAAYGNLVEIEHRNGIRTRYGHLHRIYVQEGDKVASGQAIAAMGSTGRSTGPHLHYEIWVNNKPRNPLAFVKAGQDLARLMGEN